MKNVQLYEGEILKRERVGDLKCYFVQSNSPGMTLSNSEMDERKELIKPFIDKTGYAIVWNPDVIVGHIRDRLVGFDTKDYQFPDLKEIPLSEQCPLILEVGGAESKILRNSKSKEDYLSKWVMQNRFRQKHGFGL